MKNDKYWSNRAKSERDWIDKNIKNDKDFDKVLKQHYDKLTDDIMDKINKEYISLGKRNGWTMADAQQKVKSIDIEKFEKVAKDLVKQSRELYKKNGKVSYYNFTERTNKAMRLYNATMRINRLEMLKAQIGQDIVQAGITVNSDINDKLTNDAIDEFKRQAGILGKNRSKPDLKEITKIVSAQTGDVLFSDRIWQDQASLKAELDVLLTRQMVRGISPIEIARDLRKLVSSKVDSSRYAAERIARTESARVQTQVQLASFAKYDINYCHWIAEPTACQPCTDIAENDNGLGEGIYSTTEVPYLPAHPNCRCSLSAYEPDDAQLESIGKKHVKNIDSDDKTVYNAANDIIHGDMDSVRDYFKKAYGITVDKEIKVNPDNLEDAALWLDSFTNEYGYYPQLPGSLKEIKSEHMVRKMKDVIAYHVPYDSENNLTRIALNDRFFLAKKPNNIRAVSREAMEHEWSMQSNENVQVFAHEFGHNVNHVLINKWCNDHNFNMFRDIRGAREVATTSFYNDVFKELGEAPVTGAFEVVPKLKELGKTSRYGESSLGEMFAEEFANSYANPNGKLDDLGKAFKKTLEKYLGDMKP